MTFESVLCIISFLCISAWSLVIYVMNVYSSDWARVSQQTDNLKDSKPSGNEETGRNVEEEQTKREDSVRNVDILENGNIKKKESKKEKRRRRKEEQRKQKKREKRRRAKQRKIVLKMKQKNHKPKPVIKQDMSLINIKNDVKWRRLEEPVTAQLKLEHGFEEHGPDAGICEFCVHTYGLYCCCSECFEYHYRDTYPCECDTMKFCWNCKSKNTSNCNRCSIPVYFDVTAKGHLISSEGHLSKPFAWLKSGDTIKIVAGSHEVPFVKIESPLRGYLDSGRIDGGFNLKHVLFTEVQKSYCGEYRRTMHWWPETIENVIFEFVGTFNPPSNRSVVRRQCSECGLIVKLNGDEHEPDRLTLEKEIAQLEKELEKLVGKKNKSRRKAINKKIQQKQKFFCRTLPGEVFQMFGSEKKTWTCCGKTFNQWKPLSNGCKFLEAPHKLDFLKEDLKEEQNEFEDTDW